MKDKYKDIFKNHKATYIKHSDNLHELIWKNPNSSMYYIKYIFSGCHLFIAGDCGEATFRFSEIINLNKIVEYNDLDYYIMSKFCGGDYEKYAFNEDKFKEDFCEYSKEYKGDGNLGSLRRCGIEAYSLQGYRESLLHEGVAIQKDEEYTFFELGVILQERFNIYYEGMKLALQLIPMGMM